MKQEVDIDQLMAETWLIVTMLKKGAVTHNGSALYDKCVKQVERVREALACAGYDDASVEHISYAQCALLDETVMSRKPEKTEDGGEIIVDEGQVAWRKAPLQARFFGSLQAGEALWDLIAEVLCQPAPNMAVLTCYHRVIALGFQGLFSLNAVSQTQRDEVVKALSERVAPPDANLSLVVHRLGKHRWSLMRSVWFWVALAVITTGVFWWGGHLWLQSLLSAQILELHG
ncbi:DotU family type IV/VI secretion system protein [Salmonella enterica]|nr:DotU family type IV/VI secretion system protein [Salmonella enterica]